MKIKTINNNKKTFSTNETKNDTLNGKQKICFKLASNF